MTLSVLPITAPVSPPPRPMKFFPPESGKLSSLAMPEKLLMPAGIPQSLPHFGVDIVA